MKTLVEISMYPLQDDFIPIIKGFIAALQKYPDIQIETNDTATHIRGDYDAVMALLTDEIRAAWERDGKAVFVMKVLPRP